MTSHCISFKYFSFSSFIWMLMYIRLFDINYIILVLCELPLKWWNSLLINNYGGYVVSIFFTGTAASFYRIFFTVFTEIISDHSSDSVKSGCVVRFIVQVLSRRSQANKPHSIVLITLHLILSKTLQGVHYQCTLMNYICSPKESKSR